MTCVIPGSFDPITIGHVDLVKRALTMFDSVTVLLMQNPYKAAGYYTVDQRLAMLHATFDGMERVRIDTDDGLLCDYVKSRNAVLLKGVRDSADFAYEAQMANINRSLTEVETVLLVADPACAFVSSTMVRELVRCKKDPSPYVPQEIVSML